MTASTEPAAPARPAAPGAPLLAVRDLVKHHRVGRGRDQAVVKALDGVSLDLHAGETLGVVGESGSGKSTLGRCVLGLERASSGSVVFDGQELTGLAEAQLRPLRRELQMVFQDPFSSLNPRKRVERIIGDVLRVHGQGEGAAERVAELLERVGLGAGFGRRFPRELSGGQRQRVGVARALALRPRLIVADEPVSALDVSVQAQVVNLLDELQDELGLTYLFIAHDLGVVRHVADRIAVMYLGRVVELAPSEAFYAAPHHPYGEALLSAVPVPDPELAARRERIVLRGAPPSPTAPPSGCAFHPRCPAATARCASEAPPLAPAADGRLVACHHPRNLPR